MKLTAADFVEENLKTIFAYSLSRVSNRDDAEDLIDDEITMMAKLYDELFACASKLMHIHAPKSVETHIEPIIAQTLLFRSVGLIGGCAVDSGELPLPDFDGPAAMYARLDAEPVVASYQQE